MAKSHPRPLRGSGIFSRLLRRDAGEFSQSAHNAPILVHREANTVLSGVVSCVVFDRRLDNAHPALPGENHVEGWVVCGVKLHPEPEVFG